VFSCAETLERCGRVSEVLIPESLNYCVERLLDVRALQVDLGDMLCEESTSRIRLGNPNPEEHHRVALLYVAMEAFRACNRTDVLQVLQDQAERDDFVVPAFARQGWCASFVLGVCVCVCVVISD
jgi:hypothetical protein